MTEQLSTAQHICIINILNLKCFKTIVTLALILPQSFHCENFQILEKLRVRSRTPIFSLLYAKCFTFCHIGRCVCGCVYMYVYLHV